MVDVQQLEAIIQHDYTWGRIHTTLETAKTRLETAEQDWLIQPVDLDIFQDRLPDEIKSCRITVFKPGTNLKVERHPNAAQYVRVLEGQTNFRTLSDEQNWEAHPKDADAYDIEARWSMVEPNVWHCPLPINDEGWAVLGFHTVSPDDLMTEYPES